MAGIKWWQCLCTRPSFSVYINEEAFLKVSFKNVDWFRKNYFFQKGPKNKQFLKNFFCISICTFALSTDFSMGYCSFSSSQWFFLHFNFTAVPSQLATTVLHLSESQLCTLPSSKTLQFHEIERIAQIP